MLLTIDPVVVEGFDDEPSIKLEYKGAFSAPALPPRDVLSFVDPKLSVKDPTSAAVEWPVFISLANVLYVEKTSTADAAFSIYANFGIFKILSVVDL